MRQAEIHPGQSNTDQHQHQHQALLTLSLGLAVLGGDDDDGDNAEDGHNIEHNAHHPSDHLPPNH